MLSQEKETIIYSLGECALVVRFGQEISPEINNKVRQFAFKLQQHSYDWLIEYVTAYTTVTLYYDPWKVSQGGRKPAFPQARSWVESLLTQEDIRETESSQLIEIPVCYGGSFGPDLNEVADYHQMSPQEVIEIHSSAEYLVYMVGFAPGFPYLGGLSDRIATPRKPQPRQLIPPGSVGIAGSQTGIYPLETPGGWQLIGRTYMSLFNLAQSPPALLKAGDKVKFVSVNEYEFRERKEVYESQN